MLQTAPETHQLPAVRTTMYAAVGSRDFGNTFNAKGSRTATKSGKETEPISELKRTKFNIDRGRVVHKMPLRREKVGCRPHANEEY